MLTRRQFLTRTLQGSSLVALGAVVPQFVGRTAVEFKDGLGGVPILHIGPSRLPLALTGAPGGGAVSVNDQNSFRLELGRGGRQKARRRLMEDLSAPAGKGGEEDLASFVQR